MKKNKPSSLGLKISLKFDNLSDNHKAIIDTILDRENKLIFIDGPPGSCKSFYTVYSALQLLERKSYKGILYLRSAVECGGSSLGALPGTLDEKIQPYGEPLFEKLGELISHQTTDTLIQDGMIEVKPINFLRGTTFHDKIVILDEAQNTTLEQLYIIISRLGEHSKLVLLGDSYQTDIKDKRSYSRVFQCFSTPECKEQGIVTIQLDDDDIRRNKILKFILEKLHTLKS